MIDSKKAPGQRYTHGPIKLEPFVAQVEDYDLFEHISSDYDVYIVLRKGDHTNNTQCILIGYIHQPEPDGPWEEDMAKEDLPRVIRGGEDMHNDEISRLLALGRDALNESFGLTEGVRLGDALERLSE